MSKKNKSRGPLKKELLDENEKLKKKLKELEEEKSWLIVENHKIEKDNKRYKDAIIV